MGFYIDNIHVNLQIENQENIIIETQFDKKVARLNITIIIRDRMIGRGSDTAIGHGPSIKVKGSRHSNLGDPIYFSKDGYPIFSYVGNSKLDKTEEIYLRNFINHNYLNLMNFWNAPKDCETEEFCKELQHEIIRRIQTNMNKENYENGGYDKYDSKVEISKKVQQRLKVSRRTI